ncbi:MAG: hypothetical protein WKG07_17070 [Hymenobacter sp.]
MSKHALDDLRPYLATDGGNVRVAEHHRRRRASSWNGKGPAGPAPCRR